MAENEKAVAIEIGDKVINFKEPIEKEIAEKIQKDIEDNEKLEGEFKLPTTLGEDIQIESIVFNKGKQDVTDTDRTLQQFKEENNLLKTRLDDVNSKFDTLNNQFTEVVSKLSEKQEVSEPVAPVPVAQTTPEPTTPAPVPKPEPATPEPKNSTEESTGTESSEESTTEGSDGQE